MKASYLNLIKKTKGAKIANFYEKQKNGFVKCCEEFTFIRWLDQLDFDKKMNERGITHLVLDEKHDLSKLLEHDLTNPVYYEINTVLGIIGYTGTGKSWAVLTLVETIGNAYWKINKKKIKTFICSNYNEFLIAVVESDVDDIIWCDELPLTTGKGSRVQKTELENILHQIRQRKNTFLLVDPTRIKVDVCYMYLQTAGINFKTGVSRFMLLNQNRQYFGHVYIYRPNIITEKYKKKKADQQIQIVDLRGKVTAQDIKNIESKKETDVVKRGVKILEKKLPDSRKFKKRDIYFIWRPYTKNKKIYSFKMLSKGLGLELQSIMNIFYELNKIVQKY